MNTLKRAFLYTMRKKTKTLILFLVLVTISTFILTGLSIYKAADEIWCDWVTFMRLQRTEAWVSGEMYWMRQGHMTCRQT